jgi:tetratricopeptide (TPR) repeat protein
MSVSPQHLPLPIATLVRRAKNATDPTRRHLAAYYAWEASLRLVVGAEPQADAPALAVPSVGHWVRAMPERPGSLTDPALLALHALLAEVGTEQKSAPKSTNAAKLCGLLPPYRNRVIGHGSTRNDAFNQEAARVFLEAIEPAWRLGMFFPAGSTLVLVEKVELDGEGGRKAQIVRLEGLASEREGTCEVGEDILPNRVHLRRDGELRSLYPWVLFEGGDERERVLFFNSYKSSAEYLDYASGDVLKSKALAVAFPSLEADVAALFGGGGGRRSNQQGGKKSIPPAAAPAGNEIEAAEQAEAKAPREDGAAEGKPAVRPGKRKNPLFVPLIGALVATTVGLGVWLGTKAMKGPATVLPSASASVAEGELDIPRVSDDPAVQAEFRRGIESLLQADIYGAETAFLSVKEKAPREPWPHMGLALIGAMQNHFEDSTVALDEAISLARGRTGRDAELAAVLDMVDEDLTRGLAAWEVFRAKNPKFFVAHLLAAYYYMYKGSVSEGIGRFEAARAVDGRHALTWLLESVLYMESGKLPEALTAVGKALEMQGAAPWIVAQRGMVRMRLGDSAAARADLEQAIARRGPFAAHVSYAFSLLTTGKPEDEAQFVRERTTLLDTKNVEDRLAFMCTHPLVLLREGRAREADKLLEEAVQFAVERRKQGTLIRCVLLPAYSDVALGRFAEAEVKFAKLSQIWEGFGLAKSDEARAKVMLKGLKGMMALEKGDFARAEAELADVKRISTTGYDELTYAIAVTRKEEITIPDAPEARGNFVRFRRMHLQAHAFEIRGKRDEAERAYGKILAERSKCANLVFDMHLLCAPYIADGLVRLASLQVERGAKSEAGATLAELAAFWPRADEDVPVVKRAAELRKKLDAGK